MTILFFSRLFYPHAGGVERHVGEIGKRLVKMGHSVTVVTEKLPSSKTTPPRSPKGHLGGASTETYNTAYHSDSESAKMTGEIDGIRIVRFDGGKEGFWKKFRIWLWLFRHRSLIVSVDIVHAHDVFFWYLPFRFLYPNKPVYTTFHGYETKYPPQKKAVLIRMISEKLSFGNICVGDYIRKWYGTTPTHKTYGGVEFSIFNFQFSNKKNKKLRILFIGRLEEDIGIRLYLQAIRKIKETRDLEVTFLGDGSFRHEAEKLGRVTAFQEKFVVQTDVVFASSYLSMLSAMAVKKPVIAVYTNPLKKDYLTMAPFAKWITIVDSADQIVDQVQNLKSTNRKVELAYNWVKGETWEKVIDIYLKLWKF